MAASQRLSLVGRSWCFSLRWHGVQAQLGGTGVRLQAFAVSQFGSNFAQGLCALLTDFNEARAFLKIVNTQGR